MFKQKSNFYSENKFNLIKFKQIKNILFLIVFFLVAISVFVPVLPNMPWDGLDPSWAFGMNEAVAQGLSFGKKIIFTFGPYSSIYTRTYHPATDGLMIWGSLFFAIFFAIAAYLNFRHSGWLLWISFLAFLSSAAYSLDALFIFYPMLVGVQVYYLANSIDSKKKLDITEIALKVLLFAPFGLLPLIKISFFIICGTVSALTIALLTMKGRWKLSILILAIQLLALLFFWLFSGQSLLGLGDYFYGSILIITGYSEAMSIDGNPKEYLLYLLSVALLLIFLIREIQETVYNKLFIVLTFSITLFLCFKAGFVRHDGHAVIAQTMIMLAGLLALTLVVNHRVNSTLMIVACMITWIYIDSAYIQTSTHKIKKNFENIYRQVYVGSKLRIKDSNKLIRDFESRIQQINKLGAIPKLNGSVDIYSYDQSYLISSGNKWSPRPTFQSYSAYNSKLILFNKMHLLSRSRPDNIIFKVQPIDGRLPSLEDGASWPVLLSNYEPTSFSNNYLFLKNRPNTGNSYKEPIKIIERFYSLGEQINLPDSSSPLFVKVSISKSFFGSILNILLKPSKLVIKLTMDSGIIKEYRTIAGMMDTGFVISPLVEDTQELGLLFVDANYLKDKKVKSFEIVGPHLFKYWKRLFKVEFYEINVKSSSSFSKEINLVIPREDNFINIKYAQKCDGSIDFANSPTPKLIIANSLLKISGWLATSVEHGTLPEKVYLVLQDEKKKSYFIDTKRTKRPDVAKYFNMPSLDLTGYEATADVFKLVGQYRLELAYLKNDEILICPQFNIPVKINQN